MNLNCLFDLLTNRKDLVLKYFSKANLNRPDFEKIHQEFNMTELDGEETDGLVLGAADRVVPSLSHFSESQMSLIAITVNEAHLFVREVSGERLGKVLFLFS